MRPSVSVIIPCYKSNETIVDCLLAIRDQTYENVDLIIVDSSPSSNSCKSIVKEYYPEAIYISSGKRLYPHEGRNLGYKSALSDLILFTDPDIIPKTSWINQMVQTYLLKKEIIVGSMDVFGSQWLAVAAQYVKFDLWLPRGRLREIDIAPTGNMLCSREIFDELGGFRGNKWMGDLDFSWRALENNHRIWFDPEALVFHKHIVDHPN